MWRSPVGSGCQAMRAAAALSAVAAAPLPGGHSAVPVCDFAAWDRVLKRHVDTSGEKDGIQLNVVDYCGMKADPDFHLFLQSLADANTTRLSRDEAIALYINAYNALAVNTLIRRPRSANGTGPGGCVNTLDEISPTVYKEPAGELGGRTVFLDEIEYSLRAVQNFSTGFPRDCRIHGALVCDGVSCPDLRAEAYVPERLDAQLADNMRLWLANPRKGSAVGVGASAAHVTATVSKIFLWYAADWDASCPVAGGKTGVKAFLSYYGPPALSAALDAPTGAPELQYFDYDFHINGDCPCDC